ncbi:MAG: GNAT family N-acetyltransferase [Hyphomicrobiales bacterium]|nr:GNAT family N-acetyltransferase [Hyphomicrobiales bacterium]
MTGFILSRHAAGEGEILTIAVDPANRGRGAAGALLRHHMSRLAGLGIAELFLEVDEANTAALSLYKRHGFGKVAERSGYYTLPDGRRATALVMRCAL